MTESVKLSDPVSVIVPTGMLGAGVNRTQIQYGLRRGASAIAVDSGSTDSANPSNATCRS
ncbi:hypothetical protein [Bradyrhizobium sp. CCBAU 45384]|uniref:hypothetical protein n=1 Tax=Bradyrhizobium sp. CCBAU 45384 TaxID=858428 RepID=UPI0023057B49|nr:hypothetical protein [Bradyrhizobium sp. CCBAU 45384]